MSYKYEDVILIESHYNNRFNELESNTYKPLRFTDIIQGIRDLGRDLNMVLKDESYAIKGKCEEIFGLCVFTSNDRPNAPDYDRSIGFISSHNKRRALWITSGVRVNVCSNGLLSSDGTLIKRLHSPKLELKNELKSIEGDIRKGWDSLDVNISRLKSNTQINPEKEVFNLYREKLIPHTLLIPIIKEFEQPRYIEFSEPNEWSFINAITQSIKVLDSYRQGLILKAISNKYNI